MAKSITEIQAKSDMKRWVKVKGFKLHVDDIALIEQVSRDLNIPHPQLIIDAVKFYPENKKAF